MLVCFVDGTRRPTTPLEKYNHCLMDGCKIILYYISGFSRWYIPTTWPVGGRNNELNILNSSGLTDDLPTLFHCLAIGGDLFPVLALLHSNKIFDA